MAIITGPDYLLPPFILEEDKALNHDHQTKWFLRQLEDEAALVARKVAQHYSTARPVDEGELNDCVRLALVGWENLRSGKNEVGYETEENSRNIYGQRPTRVIKRELLKRLPMHFRVSMVVRAASPQLTPEDVGN